MKQFILFTSLLVLFTGGVTVLTTEIYLFENPIP